MVGRFALAVALLVATNLPALAAPILEISGGKLAAARGVEVGGSSYDVEFVDGSCVELFSGCDSDNDFTFQTLSTARMASQALLDQVFIDGPLGNFDTMPALIVGCTVTNACGADTPYMLSSSGLQVAYCVSSNSFSEGFDQICASGVPVLSTVDHDRRQTTASVYARWTPSSVPEPASLTLTLLGFSALAVSRWQQRRRS